MSPHMHKIRSGVAAITVAIATVAGVASFSPHEPREALRAPLTAAVGSGLLPPRCVPGVVTSLEHSVRHGQSQRGTRFLRDVVVFGMGGSVTDGGISNDRRVAGSTSWSLHSVGRAVDFMVRSGRGPGRVGRSAQSIGDELFVRLVAAAPALGLVEVIWHRLIWTLCGGIKPYRGVNPHNDHVHAGQSIGASTNDAPADELRRWYGAAIFSG